MRVVLRVPWLHTSRWAIVARVAAVVLLALFLLATWWTSGFFTSFGNRVVQYALAFITVQVALLLLVGVGLMVAKTIILHLEKVHEAWQRAIEELLTDALLFQRRQEALLAECQRHPEQAEAAFGMALRRLRGEVRVEAERLFVESGLYYGLVKDILSKNPNRALFAVTLIREVDSDAAREAVRAALLHPFPIVRLAARVAVLKNGSDQARREVLDHVGTLPFWQRLALFHYVPNDSELIREYLERALASRDDEAVLAALEFVLTRQKGFPLADDLPRKLQQSKNLEVRIKLFKTLPFFSTARNAAGVLTAGLEDPDWRVRSMAARASGILRVEETKGRLLGIAAGSGSLVEVAHAARAALMLRADATLELEQVAVRCDPERAAVLTQILSEAQKGAAA
ncbi:MAG TPA: hypothetical protein VEU96_02310 [Bryobacteraceae bacterium]|nr:hypothetical protein [Bryobacteraceae bacterium]